MVFLSQQKKEKKDRECFLELNPPSLILGRPVSVIT